jgi:hypothetical protein
MNTTKITEEILKEDFKEIILKYSSKIKVSPHAFDQIKLNETYLKMKH